MSFQIDFLTMFLQRLLNNSNLSYNSDTIASDNVYRYSSHLHTFSWVEHEKSFITSGPDSF